MNFCLFPFLFFPSPLLTAHYNLNSKRTGLIVLSTDKTYAPGKVHETELPQRTYLTNL